MSRFYPCLEFIFFKFLTQRFQNYKIEPSNISSLSNPEKSSETTSTSSSFLTSLMPSSCSFLITSIPSSSFYKCYIELCLEFQLKPLKKITHQKADIILDVKTDKITCEQWIPILKALENDSSLYVIAIRCSGYYTYVGPRAYVYHFGKHVCRFSYSIMNDLWTSMSHCLDSTETLTYLELDGIPLGGMVNIFFKALRRNGTLRVLSIRNCDIGDGTCQMLCTILQNKWNIRELNLTACNLGVSSAEHIARLIKYQQIERCIQKWDITVMKINPEKKITGLRAITLKKNPEIGDDGLALILTELFDDLWIEVLDMQSCGITNKSAKDITNLVFFNPSLQIADFRKNKLANSFAQYVYNVLKNVRPNNLFFNLTYEKYLTEKYTKWTSIIPKIPSNTELSTGKFFSRIFRKRKLPHSEDFELSEEPIPERLISKDLYDPSESLSAYTDEDSIFYNRKLKNLQNPDSFFEAESSSKCTVQVLCRVASSNSLMKEKFASRIKI